MPSTSIANNSSIPPHLSFIVMMEPLKPNYGSDGVPPKTTREGYFIPPEKRHGYMRGDGPALLLRWMGGRLSQVQQTDPIRKVKLLSYNTATVFTQNDDTPHLLTVSFDARAKNVRDEGGWRPMGFNHVQIGSTDGYYSYVLHCGPERHIAAPGSPHWMPQLLPDWYQYSSQSSEPRTQAGLIGELPLLMALAAFSTPPTEMGVLLTSVQPGAWSPHGHPYPSGRESSIPSGLLTS